VQRVGLVGQEARAHVDDQATADARGVDEIGDARDYLVGGVRHGVVAGDAVLHVDRDERGAARVEENLSHVLFPSVVFGE